MRQNPDGGRRRSAIRRAAGIAALAALAAPLAMVSPALADTEPTPTLTKASVTPAPTATTPAQIDVPLGTTASPASLNGLLNGTTLTITVSGNPNPFFGFEMRLCKPGLDIAFNSDFVPSGGNCVDAPITPQSDSFKDISAAPNNTTATQTFRVGAGTRTWFADDLGTNETITCGVGNPCALWMKNAVPADQNGGITFTHYELNYAAEPVAPGVPTVSATGDNGSGTVSWTAPASTGNAPIDQYTVTVTDGSTPATQTATGSATSATFPGLTNGTPYTATVVARNATTNPASTKVGAASAPASFTPEAPAAAGPTNVQGAPGDGKVTLTWSAPAGFTADNYEVTVTPGTGVTGPTTRLTGSTATTFVFDGLTNGTAYSFTVRARNAAGAFTAASAPTTVAPTGGAVLTQTITVTRPQGALVLTQVCGRYGATPGGPAVGGGTAPTFNGAPDPQFPNYPYPTDANGASTANYPTDCTVALGAAVLMPGGQFYRPTGRLNQVTVVDRRDTDDGWTVSGTMGDFVSGPNSFAGDQLGWVPVKTSDSSPIVDADPSTPDYDQTVVAGAPVAPSTTGGLGNGATLASAAGGVGLGVAELDADLELTFPVATKAGTYAGVLTLTAL